MSDETPNPDDWPVQLLTALAGSFSLGELEALCLEMGIDPEELGEGGKSQRILELLQLVVADKRLDELLDRAEAERPDTEAWARVRQAAAIDPELFNRHMDQITEDGDIYKLYGDFTGATINIGPSLLGDWLERLAEDRRLRLTVTVAGVIVVLLATSAVLYALGVFEPEPVPDKMDGDYNIAVAEFAVLDEAGALTNAGHDGGERLADRVALNLREELADNPSVLVWVDSPELLADHHVTIGIAADDVASAEDPEAMSARLGADVLVYGRVEPADSLASQTLDFYLAPQFGQDFTNLVGNYTFAVPIPVFDPTRPSEEVWRELDPLSRALARMLLGLRLERIGEPEAALAEFERAVQLVPEADILHFFVGQENLVLAQKNEGEAALAYESAAENAFNESLRLNRENARAIIGLGGVQTVRAQRLLNTGKAPEFDGDALAMFNGAMTEAQRALATYQPVVDQEEQVEVYGLPVRSIARLGQGIALRILGDAAYRAGDPAQATEAIDSAIATLESAVAPLEEASDFRLMAQLVQALGTVYEWRGFLQEQAGDAAAGGAYDQAEAYYVRCRELGEQFPIDVYLTDRIVAELCLPRIEALQQRSES